jgi:hypothetical protein
MRDDGHDPPVTVLAEEELPALADPVDRDDDEPLDAGDGVVAVPMVVEVAAVDPVDDVPACVRAAAVASAATATVPATPAQAMSLVRRRSAWSRSAGVMGRLGADISSGRAGHSCSSAWSPRLGCSRENPWNLL